MSKKSDGQTRDASPARTETAGVSCNICRAPDDSRMVACDECNLWYHYACVQVNESVQDQDWSCERCREAAVQVLAGTSTPSAAGGTARSATNKLSEVNADDFHKKLSAMQRKLNSQLKEFEKVMKEKDERYKRGFAELREKYERELAERRVQDRVESQRLNLPFEAGPAASSTGNPPPHIIVGGGSQTEDLSQQLQLLVDRQAMEKKHLEERSQLLHRFGVADGGAAGSASGLNPQANVYQPTYRGSVFDGPSLNQSQISARQSVSKDLPSFSGNPEEWPLFISCYESSSRICGYTDEENLLRIQRSLKGKALEAVRCRLLHPSNLPGVIATLRTLFGRPEIIVHSLVNKIREMPAPRAEKFQTLIDFGVAVQNVCATIKASGLDEYLCNVALLQELTEKLPPSIRLNWAYHRQTLQRVTMSDFGDWLSKLVEAASVVTLPSIGVPRTERRNRKEDNFLNMHVTDNAEETASTSTRIMPAQKTCILCQRPCSGLEVCPKFLSMDIGSRWKVIKDRKLCRKCLRRHFGACHVKAPCSRNGCSFMHSKLLHDDRRYATTSNSKAFTTENESQTSQSCNTHSSTAEKILFRYIPVTVHGKRKTITTFAFLDDGSSATFMEHSLADELELDGVSNPLCLNWTGGQQREERESIKLPLRISGTRDASRVFELPKVHTVRSLALPEQSVSVSQLAQKYSYLKGLPLVSYKDVSPRILIGMDNCRLGHALRSAEGGENEPVASKTRLGWMIYGPCSTISDNATQSYSSFHSFHICPCSDNLDASLNIALKEYFSIDSLGVFGQPKSLVSKDDERALQILSSETKFTGERYVTGLLWRYDSVKFPDSKPMALKRHACLTKRLAREPKLAKAVQNKMAEYESKGYIRRLTLAEKAERRSNDWYLPIFPVINTNKPGKVRIVFDAAAKVNGVSLNSLLLTGPDQLVSLLTVLYKFREFKVGIVGDIREMFFQVLMRSQDQRSQMILWSNEYNNQAPEVYAVAVMTFGAACSPSSAHFVKNKNADRFSIQYPRAVECIKYEHYVDDMLASVETEGEAVKLANDVRFVHAQGGFEIRNWLSNSRAVIKSLREKEVAEKNMSICAEMATEKVLGMWWETATDMFTFKLSSKHDADLLTGVRIPTKREMLRTLMTIYDPLGLIGNFMMYLKILMQEVWRSGCNWDDDIPEKLAAKWLVWIEVLPNVQKVKVPRCYRHITSAKASNVVQLHIFCDASESGVAAVAYFRFEERGSIECALVGTKTRVAPLKFVSVPRLELQAAVIGARLATSIASSHRITISRRVLWTDSRDVICWLRSDHRRYSQFVAFRVSELLDLTEAGEWRWLSTKLNVADEGTKWQKLPTFEPDNRWFRGPYFIWEAEENWPGSFADLGTTKEEIRPSVLHHVISQPLIIFQRFSKWKRLLRTVAFVHRFCANLAKRVKGQAAIVGPLSQEELSQAENTIYRHVQKEVFYEEIHILSKKADKDELWSIVLPKCSPLYKRSAFLDAQGILRMRGRTENCKWLDDSAKYPILMPKRNYVTALLIADFHNKYHHQNHQSVMNEIRLKFDIPQLRSEIDRVRRSCQYCKVRHAKPHPTSLGALPPARLAAFQRPFSYTGIDYFGPMQVIVGRRVEKRWGVLLTCLTTRAVHIEIAHTLTADSCILALRNFVARRGTPIQIISDRGTNFVGASRELENVMKGVDEKLMIEFTGPTTKWSFNPPSAPHFGGCWERLVQSIKKILNVIKPSRLPTDELLRSMLMEIELLINSRPLTHVSVDADFEPPLTPNHFLMGSANGSKPPIAFNDKPEALKNSWKSSQIYANEFWKKWVAEYLPTLTRKTRWFQPVKPIQEGDLGVVVDERLPRNCWPLGRVVKVVRSNDGQVRSVTLQTTSGLLERPAVKVAVIDVGSG